MPIDTNHLERALQIIPMGRQPSVLLMLIGCIKFARTGYLELSQRFSRPVAPGIGRKFKGHVLHRDLAIMEPHLNNR